MKKGKDWYDKMAKEIKLNLGEARYIRLTPEVELAKRMDFKTFMRRYLLIDGLPIPQHTFDMWEGRHYFNYNRYGNYEYKHYSSRAIEVYNKLPKKGVVL